MIYLTSLSDGFDSMASIFSSMTQAVGAADKVFQLIRREPKGIASPQSLSPGNGVSALPEVVCTGKVELKGVEFEYPSR